MKKIMLMGRQSAGKTTLCQFISGRNLEYKKTQSIEVIDGFMIDTPGEYVEQRSFYRALSVTAVEADVILFVLDPTDEDSFFAPGLSSMFTKDCIGVITKSDISSEKQMKRANDLLEITGVQNIFSTSSTEGKGFEDLINYLKD